MLKLHFIWVEKSSVNKLSIISKFNKKRSSKVKKLWNKSIKYIECLLILDISVMTLKRIETTPGRWTEPVAWQYSVCRRLSWGRRVSILDRSSRWWQSYCFQKPPIDWRPMHLLTCSELTTGSWEITKWDKRIKYILNLFFKTIWQNQIICISTVRKKPTMKGSVLTIERFAHHGLPVFISVYHHGFLPNSEDFCRWISSLWSAGSCS